jgi:hypothetical protein
MNRLTMKMVVLTGACRNYAAKARATLAQTLAAEAGS